MKFHHHFIHWWHGRREKFYRRNRWHLVLDISLSVVILLLLGLSLRLALYSPAVIDAISNSIHQLNGGQDKRVLSLQTDIFSLQNNIKAGDVLSWRVHYKNNGNVKIDNAKLSIDLASAAFNLNILSANDSSDKSLSVKNNQVELEDIAVNAEGDFTITASWRAEKSDFPRIIKGNLLIKAYSGALSFSKESPFPEIKIISNLTVNASVYFHSPQGDQLGIGPVPPIIGVPTTYWLIVKALNNGNDLENFVFSAKLPDNVDLNDEQSLLAGKFTYNKESRRLVWQVDSLAATGGDYIANFALVLTPTASQLGQNAALLKDLQYHVSDTLTNTEISAFLKDLDSSLPDDRLNRGQGKVSE